MKDTLGADTVLLEPRSMAKAKGTRATPPWWMVPHLVVPALLIPLLTAAWLVPVEFHWELGRYAKFLDFGYFTLGVSGVGAFVLGSVIVSRFTPSRQMLMIDEIERSITVCNLLQNICWVLFAISVIAYAIWFMPILHNPGIIFDIISSEEGPKEIREGIGTIPGITTLVQAQVPYLTLIVVRYLYLQEARPTRLEKCCAIFIVVLTCFRNAIWSERIAVIELVMPAIILILRNPRFPRLTAFAPIIAFAGLFSFFSVFEYFRSWEVYYKYHYDNFVVFILWRLSGYYLTALDNGAGLVHDWGSKVFAPLNTLDWFWRFPWEIGQTYLSKLMGLNLLDYGSWLTWNASPEFNNPSGIYMPFVDYGPMGGLVFLFLFGALTGVIYRGFVIGGVAALLIYPLWFMGLLEMPRILYHCEARFFPIIVIAILIIALTKFCWRNCKEGTPQRNGVERGWRDRAGVSQGERGYRD